MFNKLLVFFMMFFFVLPLAFAAEQEVKGTTQVINPVEIDGITVSSMEDAWEATEDSQEFRDVALEMGYQEEQIDRFYDKNRR